MTLTPEILLSDQFAEFSGKVTALHEKKKELVAEFKKLYEEHRAQIKALDEGAAALQDGFNDWAANQAKGQKPPKETK